MTDYLILVPLDEEWRTVSKILIPGDSNTIPDRKNASLSYHLWRHPVTQDVARQIYENGDYLMAGIPMSLKTRGQAGAAVVSNLAIASWKPYHIVMMGIAGSIEPEKLLLGDVVVSDQIFGYEVSDAEKEFKFRRTTHRTGPVDLDRVRTLFNDEGRYSEWQEKCLAAGRAIKELPEKYLRPPTLHIRNTASGNSVVKSQEFANELKKQLDNSIAAVEMEATGLFTAMEYNDECKHALMIRGISDYADEKKAALESESHDTVRAWASGNAARLLTAILQTVPYTPISEPYQLDVAIGAQTGTRPNDQMSGIEFSQKGAQNLCFPKLLQRASPSPELTLEVQVEKAGDAPVAVRGLCILGINNKATVVGRPLSGGGIFFIIPPGPAGVHVEMLLSCDTRADKIHIQCSDLFKRKTKRTVNFN